MGRGEHRCIRKARQWFRTVTKQRKLTREVVKCVAKLKSTKTAGADKIVNEFMNYGGEGMLTMMVMLYNRIWENEYPRKRCREGVVVNINIFKKGDKPHPGTTEG